MVPGANGGRFSVCVYASLVTLQTLQRRDWTGEPFCVGDLFRLHKNRCGQQIEAACRLVTHQLGWEVQLEVAGSLQRSHVCRSQDEVLDTSEQWKAAMVEKGWA
jgi:hypothetical protein